VRSGTAEAEHGEISVEPQTGAHLAFVSLEGVNLLRALSAAVRECPDHLAPDLIKPVLRHENGAGIETANGPQKPRKMAQGSQADPVSPIERSPAKVPSLADSKARRNRDHVLFVFYLRGPG
jgi:hypothetical protein